MLLVTQYVTFLSALTCYLKLTLHLLQISNATVKVDLTYCWGGSSGAGAVSQVQTLFTEDVRSGPSFPCVLISGPSAIPHQSLFTSPQMICKTYFFCLVRVFIMSTSDSQTSLCIPSNVLLSSELPQSSLCYH